MDELHPHPAEHGPAFTELLAKLPAAPNCPKFSAAWYILKSMPKNNSPKAPVPNMADLLEENRQLREKLDSLRAEKFALRERQISQSAGAAHEVPVQRTFAGVYIHDGQVRRMTFEATNSNEAQALASDWGVGVDGEVERKQAAAAEVPMAFDLAAVRRILGGVSRSQIYVWLTLGRLERLPGTRRVLITRASVEKFQQAA